MYMGGFYEEHTNTQILSGYAESVSILFTDNDGKCFKYTEHIAKCPVRGVCFRESNGGGRVF